MPSAIGAPAAQGRAMMPWARRCDRRRQAHSGRAAARRDVRKRGCLRLHRLKCHAPVQFAVRTTLKLRCPTEMKVGMSWVANRPTAVMLLECSYSLGFLGLGHV